MSNFVTKAKVRRTGREVEVYAFDDYYGKHQYGYRVDGEMYTEGDFNRRYELLDSNPTPHE